MAAAAFALAVAGIGMLLWRGGNSGPPIAGFQVGSGGGSEAQLKQQLFKARFAPNVVLVAFEPKSTVTERLAIARRYRLTVDPKCQSPYFVRFVMGQPFTNAQYDVESTAAALTKEPVVRIAEPDFAITPDQALPNDPRFNELWGLHNTGQTGGTIDADIDAPDAWAIVGPRPPVVVADLDDGCDYNHPDLAANIWTNPGEIAGNGIDDDGNGFVDDTRGWDTAYNDNDPFPDSGYEHGTHTAGTIAAVGDNLIGICGASRNVRLMPIKMYAGQSSWMSDLIEGIDYAWQNGAKVISVSYNIDSYTQLLVDAIVRAGNADVIYCNSAGNNGQQNPPRQNIRSVTTNSVFVAASDHNDTLASFSNWGSLVDIAAPGVAILSTTPGNTYQSWDGTSMATPHMAGACAVVRSYFPALSARQVLDRLIYNADVVPGLVGKVTRGRLNLNNAIEVDSTPPSDPTALKELAFTTSSAKIRFNGSGDDGAAGMATRYEVRMSSSPITLANFGSATLLPTAIAPVAAGTPIDVVLSGMPQGISYLAVRAFDNMGNASANISVNKAKVMEAPILETGEGAPKFSATGTWALTTEQAASPTHAWSDSPGGSYVNSADSAITLIDSFTALANQNLKFQVRGDLESGYDYLRVELTNDGGATWTQLASFTGTIGSWTGQSISLNAYAGQTVKVRFRLTSDTSVVKDGVYIDDVSLLVLTPIHLDDFEGANSYTPTGLWYLSTLSFNSPTHSWDDGPGSYANNASQDLTRTAALDFSAYANITLSFMCNLDTEANYDYLRIMTSTDGGANFAEMAKFSGSSGGWKPYSVSLPSGSNLLKFRFTSDGSVTRTGIFLDDLKVTAERWMNVR